MSTVSRILPLVDSKGQALTASWLNARKLAAGYGGLPSIFLLNKDPGGPGGSGDCTGQNFWSRQVLVHPARGCAFTNANVVEDHGSTGQWVLPAKYIPEQAIGKQNLALLIVPATVRTEEYPGPTADFTYERRILHPKSVRVLNNGNLAGGEVVWNLSGLGRGDAGKTLQITSRIFDRDFSITPVSYIYDGKTNFQATWHFNSTFIVSVVFPKPVAKAAPK
jgi:hypothetical protein